MGNRSATQTGAHRALLDQEIGSFDRISTLKATDSDLPPTIEDKAKASLHVIWTHAK